jgi:xanthine dehydrogenase YagS FAD-binding subunit
MHPFRYARVGDVASAVALASSEPNAAFVAGGTELLNWIKDGLVGHTLLIDVNGLPLGLADVGTDGARIGALARMSDVAELPALRAGFPALSEALLAGASPQVRNMASIGGNLMQRTRCWYFRDPAFACNKRAPGSGCPAIDGENRWHAILGGSDACIAVHPSDLAVALLALDAAVLTEGPRGTRSVPIDDFYLLPGRTPERETVLEPGELIVGVEVPATRFAARSHYLKVRDRASFEFALVSAAVALDLDSGVVREARVALGGVAPRPWRAREAEDALRGRPLTPEAVATAGAAAVQSAVGYEHNRFKIELTKRVIARALSTLGGIA